MRDPTAAKSLQPASSFGPWPSPEIAAQRSPGPKGKGDRCKGLVAPCANLQPCTDVSAAHRCGSLQSLQAETDEAVERDAIMNEGRYATRQTIPQAAMIAGLIATAFASGNGSATLSSADFYAYASPRCGLDPAASLSSRAPLKPSADEGAPQRSEPPAIEQGA